jgi:hypothetical protein
MNAAASSPTATLGAMVFAIGDARQHGGVRDPQTLAAEHPKAGVDDGEVVTAHPGGAGLVPERLDGLGHSPAQRGSAA